MFKKYLSVVFAISLVFTASIIQVAASDNDTEILIGYSQGDVNLDADVNIKDATLIQKHLADLSKIDDLQLSLADIDGKLGVNIKDATHLQKWIAGIIDNLYENTNTTDPTPNPDTPIELPFIPVS